MTIRRISPRLAYQPCVGFSSSKSHILPVPLIVSVLFSSFHVRLSPHFPLVGAFSANVSDTEHTTITAASTIAKTRFPVFICSSSLIFKDKKAAHKNRIRLMQQIHFSIKHRKLQAGSANLPQNLIHLPQTHVCRSCRSGTIFIRLSPYFEEGLPSSVRRRSCKRLVTAGSFCYAIQGSLPRQRTEGEQKVFCVCSFCRRFALCADGRCLGVCLASPVLLR